MNRHRAALGITAFIAIATVGGAVAFHTFLDPERIKRVAKEKARDAGMGELTIGDLSLTLWPLPSVNASAVSIPGVFRLEHLTARLALLPLLAGKARYKSAIVDGLTVEIDAAKETSGRFKMETLNELESLRVHDTTIRYQPREGKPVEWRIEEGTAEADPGLRDVGLDASIQRGAKSVTIKAQFADLSRLGVAGATTEGRVHADWGQTQLAVEGRLPIGGQLAGQAVRADLNSTSLTDFLAFLGVQRRKTAPVQARFEMSEAQDGFAIANIDGKLGALRLTGDARVSLAGPKPNIDVRIATENLDWVRAQLDAGAAPVPPLTPPEMFYDIPLAWGWLEGLKGSRGQIDARIGRLLLRNGLELRNFKAKMGFDDDRLDVSTFTAEMLGGTASGSVNLEGRTKRARAKFEGTNLLMERWFRERGSQVAFKGGPMRVSANVSATGASMKQLAASMSGPVSIRMGPGVLASEKAGQAEAVMTGLGPGLAEKDATQIDFECAGAMLPFTSGRAVAQPIIGARSAASHLITSGHVDLREQTLDLRGRLKAKSGVNLGLGAIAGDVLISGKIRQPRMTLDPAGTPAAIVRGVAAVATLGLSVLGTGLVDAANTRKQDPCEVIFK